MIEIVCMDENHYDSVQHFIEEEHLESSVEKHFAAEIKEGKYIDAEDVIKDHNFPYEVIDIVAEEYLKRLYPEDYFQRSLMWVVDEWSDGLKILIYRAEFNNKEDATKFIINTIQEMSIDSTDLFIGAVENLK